MWQKCDFSVKHLIKKTRSKTHGQKMQKTTTNLKLKIMCVYQITRSINQIIKKIDAQEIACKM